MWAGIAAVAQGNRLVDISRSIEGYIRRQPRPASGKYGIVEDYGGHGIGSQMHMDPHLLNYVDRRRGRGPKLVPGFCLAIEPMVRSVPEDPCPRGRLDGQDQRRHLVQPLGAHGRPDRGRAAGADRIDGGKAKLAELRRHHRSRPAG